MVVKELLSILKKFNPKHNVLIATESTLYTQEDGKRKRLCGTRLLIEDIKNHKIIETIILQPTNDCPIEKQIKTLYGI